MNGAENGAVPGADALPEPRIEHHDGSAFEWTVPVLVIGAGACGLTAALAAREQGIEVLVLEQDAQPSGSSSMSYGAICAAGSRMQQRSEVEDRADWLFEDILAVTRGQTDKRLARTLAEHSGPTVDWLVEKHGLELTVETAWTGLGHRRPRLHAPRDRSGARLMGMLLAALETSGADLLTEARVTTLLVDEAQRVRGVRMSRPDGSQETLGCDALVLASCGFGANSDWVARYMPEVSDARYYGHEGNRGDAMAWGRAMGAALAHMGSFQALGSLADPQALVIPHTLLIGGGVQVNSRGERFEDELDDISGQALTILQQPDGICWIVYDQRLHEEALERFAEYADAAELKAPRVAQSWGDLAARTGLPEPAFQATMKDVAALVESGLPDAFGRIFDAGQALQPPYYAIRVTGALFHTQGGLVVDERARVLTEQGQPLPNLFAGGGAACSVSGPGGWAYLPGMGLCTAVTLGRLAGVGAAQLADKAVPVS